MTKYPLLNKILPHAIAIGVFLIMTLIFCKPALESDAVLVQGDVTSWQGMSHQAMEYKEQHGHYPLWVTNMFGGMPAYQIAMEGSWSPLSVVDKVIQFGLPQPFNFFFLACICFYFLCVCLSIRPLVGILGAIAFAYCSYNPIIVTAGHNTKMLALAYAPAVLGAAILIFDKKYLIGFALMAVLTSLQIAQGHQQITYYLFLVLGAMGISYLVHYIKSKDYGHILKSGGLIITSVILGLATNALVLMTTYDYTKDSKRGGQLVMKDSKQPSDVVKDGKTQGLSKDYAFQWSYGKAETWSLMFPGIMGYGYHQAENGSGEPYIFPKLDENSHVQKYFSDKAPGIDPQFAARYSRFLYWGDQPFTNGPVYLGAIVCFLFIIGMFYLDGRHKWWILFTCIFAILLSWGSHFQAFNYFMFDHFPFYNKFRVPTLALVIPQLLAPIIAVLTLEKMHKEKEQISLSTFKKPMYLTLGIFVMMLGFKMTSNFSNENKEYAKIKEAENTLNIAIQSDMKNLEDSINKIASGGIITNQQELQNLYNLRAQKIYASYDGRIKEISAKMQASPPGSDDKLRENIMNDKNLNALAQQLKMDPKEMSNGVVQAVRQDRASNLLSDIMRSFLLILAVFLTMFLYFRNYIGHLVFGSLLCLLVTIDLFAFGMHYMNASNFISKSTADENNFPISAAENQVLQDKDPNFRVMNSAEMEKSRPSYHYKAIGGYHPAKLGIYDDLLAYQLNGSKMNANVINMLNVKYKITNPNMAERNKDALGNVWFVNEAKFVKGPSEEMQSLDNFDPAKTAIIDESFKSKIGNFSPSQQGETITQTEFDNDAITYQSNSKSPHLAVFSEIYYKDWKAYIDGQPADFVKCNYVLRAMMVPAGNHKIEFKFEPKAYYTGKKIAAISSWLVILLLLGSIAFPFVQKKFKKPSADIN